MNANPLVWGNSNRRLPQLANLICDDADEEMTNNVDDEVLSSIFNKMNELSLQGLDRFAKSVQPEIEKCVRLAAEAEKEKDERERLAAEEEEKERERLAAEAKKVEEEARIALAAVEAKAKEERLAVEAKEKECERLAAEAKEEEEARQTSKDSDPEFVHDPFGDMEDDAAKDDAISISSVEDDGELDEAEQEADVDDDFEAQLLQRFASALQDLETIYDTDFKPDEITYDIQEKYQLNCKITKLFDDLPPVVTTTFEENARQLSRICIGHTGKLRKKKLIIGAGRTSPKTQRKSSRGKQQAACFIVCLDTNEADYFDKEIEVYPHLLFGIGDNRHGPQNCLAFMEIIKVIRFCDCDEIEVWIKSTLRVALDDEDFLYYAVSI